MFCQRTKEYLSQKGIQFTDRDVTKNESALDELKRLHAMTTPVTVIGGEVIIGFDPDKFDRALSQYQRQQQ
jgi:glutaredoxin